MILYRTVELCGVELEIMVDCLLTPPDPNGEGESFKVINIMASSTAAERRKLAGPLRDSLRVEKNLFGGMNAGITE